MPLPTSPSQVSDQSSDGGRFASESSVEALDSLLTEAVALGASDVHLRSGSVPMVRISGELRPLGEGSLSEADMQALVSVLLDQPRARASFSERQECDFAIQRPGPGRFRGSAFRERGRASIVLRHVLSAVPSMSDLGLPDVLERLALTEAGLVLVSGPTGSGKSTTLAAMVSLINDTRRCHVLTIEDPIEYVHIDHLARISQREVGTDTDNFASALRSGMRQDPDVICVGEIRDAETLRTALQAAETGHLVLASLHARSATDAVSRICDLFPADEQRQARTTLAEVLVGIVCQRLVARADGEGRTPVLEILVSNARVRDAITDPVSSSPIQDVIAEGAHYGMRTMQDDLVRLVINGDIDVSDAERIAISPADLQVALKRAGFRATVRRGA